MHVPFITPAEMDRLNVGHPGLARWVIRTRMAAVLAEATTPAGSVIRLNLTARLTDLEQAVMAWADQPTATNHRVVLGTANMLAARLLF